MSDKTLEQLEAELAEAQAKIQSLQTRLDKARERADRTEKQCHRLLTYMSACSGNMLQGHDWNTLANQARSLLRAMEGGKCPTPETVRGFLRELTLFMTSPSGEEVRVTDDSLLQVKPLSYFCRSSNPLLRNVTVIQDASLEGVVVRYLPDVMFPVLANLIRNARNYGRVEGVPLSLHFAFEHIDDKDYLTLQDNGPGIPEGVTLFEPFSSTAKFGNLRGLGLYLCRELCRFHGRDLIHIPTEGGAKFGIQVKVERPREDQ